MTKKAFTLVEMMVVLAILAIISVLAYTSFRSASAKAKWGEVTPCLAEAVNRLANYQGNHGTYPTSGDPFGDMNLDPECGEHYAGSISVTNGGASYIIAYFDSRKKIWGGSGNDTWVQTDRSSSMIHHNNTVDNKTEPLPSGYSLPPVP